MSSPRFFWKVFAVTVGLNLVVVAVLGVVLSVVLHDPIVQPASVRRWVWSLVLLQSAGVLALGYVLVRRLVRPIAALNRAASKISAGDYDQRVYVLNRDELGTLAGTLNRVSESLGQRMAQLGQTAARQATVLGGMIEGVIAIDDRERIVLANEAAGRMYGFRPTDVEGRPLLEVIRNHDLHAAVGTALETGEPQRIESLRLPTQKVNVDIHVQPLPGVPRPGVVLVLHDTTELRRLESIRRDFMANMSHELKTPLSSIKAYAETLQNGDADAQTTKRFLSRIEEQADRLHHLILDMLVLARIESDHQSFDITSVDVAETVQASLEAQRPAAAAKRIELRIDCEAALQSNRLRVRADREALRQILDNLVDNAIKYTPEGGSVTIGWNADSQPSAAAQRGARSREQRESGQPETYIEPRASDQPHRLPCILHPASCILSIGDTGIGIKPQDQQRIFERFYRVDKARSRELGGTGLGLSIVKHLTHAMGGQVSVSSTPGEGSTFTIELPLDLTPPALA